MASIRFACRKADWGMFNHRIHIALVPLKRRLGEASIELADDDVSSRSTARYL